jgi:hypothetical protein
MRALCGAIITAGAMIGLGLTALGIGTRYGADVAFTEDTAGNKVPYLIHITQMDRPLVFVLVFLTCVALVGLGIAFVGLAYHHNRRHLEHLLQRERWAAQHPTSTPTTTPGATAGSGS